MYIINQIEEEVQRSSQLMHFESIENHRRMNLQIKEKERSSVMNDIQTKIKSFRNQIKYKARSRSPQIE